MFLEFFGLREQPFGMSPDPAYLYASRTHGEALASLSFGIAENRGFFALIAEPGMGKTTLLYHLMEKLRENTRTVLLFQTQCSSREFIEYILQELGADVKGMSFVAMHGKLNEILFEELLAGKRFVLVVDEAQNLDDSVLETVRMLSNFETHNAKLLQIVLAGQPRLAKKLAQPELSQLRQRIAVLSRLQPFSAEDTELYIGHRLKVAGHGGEPIFEPDAIRSIARLSDGIPRNINNICYNALFLAYTRGHRTVTAEIVREVVARLDLEPLASEPSSEPIAVAGFVAAPDASAQALPAPAVETLAVESLGAETRAAETLAVEVPAVESPAPLPAPVPAPNFNDRPVAGFLTYDAGKKNGLPGWRVRSAILVAVVLFGALSLVVLGRSQWGQGLTPAIFHRSSGAPAAPIPADQSAGTTAGYDADPQDTGSGQVITVMAGPQQTLQDLTLRYVGHFDSDLSEKIRNLNPDLKDPDHLEAGQLIRIPLPPGAMKKVNDTAEASAPSKSENSGNLFTKFTAMLRGRR